jgi:hypothetical protein
VVAGRIGSNQTGAPYRNPLQQQVLHAERLRAVGLEDGHGRDGYKQCVMGTGAHQGVEPSVTVWRGKQGVQRLRQVVPGVTADGRTVRYDFESGVGRLGRRPTASSSCVGQRGGRPDGQQVAEGDVRQRREHLRIAGPTGLSLAAGNKVSFYIYLSATSKLTR